MSEEEKPVADRWMALVHECPYCGEFQQDEGCVDEEWVCINCGKEYILGDC